MRKQEREWSQEYNLSVEEALREAMQTPQARGSAVESPRDLPAPLPHLPLRKASPDRLQSKRPTPLPMWTPTAHEVRGFNPATIEALPQLDSATASSEHAFAGKDETRKQPFKPPLGVLEMRQEQELRTPSTEQLPSSPIDGNIGRPPSSPVLTPPASPRRPRSKGLRSARSTGEGFKGWKNRFSSPNRTKTKPPVNGEIRSSVPVRPSMPAAEVRDSFRSAVTSNRSAVTSGSSFLHTSSILTGHSSYTAASSHNSDYVHVFPSWSKTTLEEDTDDEDMTVEDAIGMYVDGFESARPSVDTQVRNSQIARRSLQGKRSFQDIRPSSQRSERSEQAKRRHVVHRRSQSASLLLGGVRKSEDGGLTSHQTNHQHTFSRILSAPAAQNGVSSNRNSVPATGVPRDRYGFKKASLYVTVERYDAWNVQYSEHLERRRKKWHTMMKSYGLNTQQPFRFPPKSDKIKRYVRKGIPPEFRGAAWFWYAGGPSKLAKEPGLYHAVLEKVKKGELSDNDREHIERDLNRTFPDNVRFKPDPSTMMDAQAGAGGGEDNTTKKRKNRDSTEPETPIVQSLRRVLQAFAVHNQQIGYCQSLNFIAGLLLVFLDQDEEKAFILLNFVTTVHLPGTHGIALEGANIDIAVLMSCIKDSLPAIWAKLDDNGGAHLTSFPGAQALRLPTVSLATTAWFMSLFVGTLPIESVLRIWDCLFFEGSKTLFRIALAIFKFGEKDILAVSDPMEIFQVVQTIPRGMLDVNGLMEMCFRRRSGFGHVSQGLIEGRREERRKAVREGVASIREVRGSIWRGRWRPKTKG